MLISLGYFDGYSRPNLRGPINTSNICKMLLFRFSATVLRRSRPALAWTFAIPNGEDLMDALERYASSETTDEYADAFQRFVIRLLAQARTIRMVRAEKPPNCLRTKDQPKLVCLQKE